MPFLAEKTWPIPTKDIASWSFDDLKYDWETPIYIDALNTNNFITARRAKQLIRQLVAGFNSLPGWEIGKDAHNCVCIHSFNDIHYPIFFQGIAAAGGVFAGTNPAYTPSELMHTIKIARAKYVLVQPALLEPVLKAFKQSGTSTDRIIIFNPNGEKSPEGYLQWHDLLKHGEKDWVRFDDLETSRNSIAALLFSSGTTGLPKATMLSHYNLIAQHTLIYEADAEYRDWVPKRMFALPMFHAATAPVSHTSPLREGSQGYVLPRFEPETWFWCHEKYGITDTAFVPPIAVMAVNSPLKEKYSLKGCRIALSGAAPMDKLLQARVQQLIGSDTPMTQVWGMTETSCICSRFPFPETDDTGAVGYPIRDIDIKLVDDSGKDITGYGVRGEICVRGPTVVRGYFENPEANERDWDREGFFHTGDIGYCDESSKKWYIVDRKKELIKVRAFQVAPPEVEGVLLEHPEVVDAAVIGVPDPGHDREGSELPRAYLVKRPESGKNLSERDIHAWTKERLASYKQCLGGIVFVDAIPKNASGKILKRILREQAKKEMGAKL